jgi:dihydroorotase
VTRSLIRGGIVIDPAAGTELAGDVLIEDGSVRGIGVGIGAEGADVVEAEGLYVAPGLIDIHTHVFSSADAGSTRVPADRVGIEQGVACLVDAGSSGASTADAFPGAVHATQRTPTYGLINIGSPGMPRELYRGGGHSSRVELCSLEGTVAAIERQRDWVRGVKVQASASHAGEFGLDAVGLAVEAAQRTELPLMVHIGNAPPRLDDVLDLLREGDIVTHVYHGKPGGALTAEGEALPALVRAVERGVRIDLGHGRSSFAFATFERARAAGLPLHSISTDIHAANVERYVVSLGRTMSKVMALGSSLVEVVRAVTSSPAGALRLDGDGFGMLRVGAPAQISLLRLREDPLEVEDAEGERRTLPRWIEPVAVYVAGERHERTAPL